VHLLLALQATLDSGFRVDPAWVITGIATIISTLAGTVAVLYRGQIAALRERITWLEGELSKRDKREEVLVDQLVRQADTLERDVSLHERSRGSR